MSLIVVTCFFHRLGESLAPSLRQSAVLDAIGRECPVTVAFLPAFLT